MAALQGQHAWSVCSCAGMGGVREPECLATGRIPPFSDRGFAVLSQCVGAFHVSIDREKVSSLPAHRVAITAACYICAF